MGVMPTEGQNLASRASAPARGEPRPAEVERFRDSMERHKAGDGKRMAKRERSRLDPGQGEGGTGALQHMKPAFAPLPRQGAKSDHSQADGPPRALPHAEAAPRPVELPTSGQPSGGGIAEAPLAAAFAARMASPGAASSETLLSFADSRWAARDALIVGAPSGDVSLSLNLNQDARERGNGNLEELRRRLEARGILVAGISTD